MATVKSAMVKAEGNDERTREIVRESMTPVNSALAEILKRLEGGPTYMPTVTDVFAPKHEKAVESIKAIEGVLFGQPIPKAQAVKLSTDEKLESAFIEKARKLQKIVNHPKAREAFQSIAVLGKSGYYVPEFTTRKFCNGRTKLTTWLNAFLNGTVTGMPEADAVRYGMTSDSIGVLTALENKLFGTINK